METLNEILNWVNENGAQIIVALLTIVGGASVIAKLTPTPKDDAFLAKVKALLEKVALNPVLQKEEKQKEPE